MTNLLQITLNARKAHRHTQRILQLVSGDHALFVWLVLHVSLCGQQHPKCERSNRVAYPSFVNFPVQTTPQKKINGVVSGYSNGSHLDNYSEFGTCSYELPFSQWPILSPTKILTFLPESPCICSCSPYLQGNSGRDLKTCHDVLPKHPVT